MGFELLSGRIKIASNGGLKPLPPAIGSVAIFGEIVKLRTDPRSAQQDSSKDIRTVARAVG
jgi:hypothetical protein